MELQASNALNAASGLRELIIDNRNVTESNRQVADPIVDAIIESGLGRMALPAERGGLDVAPADSLDVFEALAEAEASVAWIVWNSALPCWFARYLSEETYEEVFGSPDCLYTSSTRPTGKATMDGQTYVVNGRWSLVSGCMHAQWIPVMCMVEADGELQMLAPGVPHMRMCFVPRERFEILDTWHVGGLRGTGSHDAVLSDEIVPASRSFSFADPSMFDSARGRMPIISTMSSGCASICVGIAQRSLDALIELATSKIPVDGGPGLRDRAHVQSLVARTRTKLDSLRTGLKSSVEDLWRKAGKEAGQNASEIGAVFGASVSAAQECRAAVTEIYAAAGTSSLYTDSPIERAHRDIHAVTLHIALQPFWLEQAGRVRLGLEPTHPLFAL